MLTAHRHLCQTIIIKLAASDNYSFKSGTSHIWNVIWSKIDDGLKLDSIITEKIIKSESNKKLILIANTQNLKFDTFCTNWIVHLHLSEMWFVRKRSDLIIFINSNEKKNRVKFAVFVSNGSNCGVLYVLIYMKYVLFQNKSATEH